MPKLIRFGFIFFLPLFVSSQTVDFSFQSTSGAFCSPATIQFTQSITGNPTDFSWNLGNGLRTNKSNPLTSYTNAGTYTVKLIAIFPSGPVEVSKEIVITPAISPNIVLGSNYVCQTGPVNFSASSNGNIQSYDWDFGDSTGIVSTPDKNTTHTFARYDSFSIIVKVTDVNGCFGQDTIPLNVKRLPVKTLADQLNGCITANVNFTSTVQFPTGDAAASYEWDFGDGTNSSTTTGDVSHNYTKTGSYSPVLTVTSTQGCTNTFKFPRQAYGTPPTGSKAYSTKTEICGSELPKLVGKATGANSYAWNFDDGTTDNSVDTFITHKFNTLGLKNVRVTPYSNGCAGSSSTFQINVIGVLASAIFSNVCSDKKTFQLYNFSKGKITSTLWEFGDGGTSTVKSPEHIFPASGAFLTKLTVNDSVTGCLDTTSIAIYTATPVVVNPDAAICINTKTTFTISNGYNNPRARYIWNVLGQTFAASSSDTITVTADSVGYFDNFVVVTNGPRYCLDTVYLKNKILVRGPLLDFNIAPNSCFADSLVITNNSKPFVAGDDVTQWAWNYGKDLPGDSIYQPTALIFDAPNTYTITLSAIDKNGCMDSLVKTTTVNPLPFLKVLPAADTLCSGQPDTLYAYHSDSITWSPATGLSCVTCDTVVAKPTSSVQYYVTATTPANCSIRDSIMVNVIKPFTASPVIGNAYICKGDEVTLDMGPKNKVIVWSPAEGLSDIHSYTPTAKPGETTVYTATLTDSLGCSPTSASLTVFIKSTPVVDAGPDKVVPYNSTFNITPTYGSNVVSYLWSPDVTLSCSTCASPSGTALISQSYTVKVTSDSGCVATDQVNIIIECKESNIFMPSAFTPNNDNLNDYFYPITRGIKTIVKFVIYNREGKIMYEGRNFLPNSKTAGWDGNYRGVRQSATGYVYILEALCEQGMTLNKSGSVLLLR